jgi:hypothetical protein
MILIKLRQNSSSGLLIDPPIAINIRNIISLEHCISSRASAGKEISVKVTLDNGDYFHVIETIDEILALIKETLR